jgi:cytochrome P450
MLSDITVVLAILSASLLALYVALNLFGIIGRSQSTPNVINDQNELPTEQEQKDIGIKIANGCVMLQSQEACAQILSRDIMRRHPDLGLGDLFNRWLGMCLGALDSRDPRWGKTKRIFRPLFERVESIDVLIQDWHNTLQRTFETMKLTGEAVPISEIVDNLPLNYILRLVFGKTFVSNHSDNFVSLRQDAATLMFNVFNNNHAKSECYRYLPTDVNTTLARFGENWENILELAEGDTDVFHEGSYQKLLSSYESATGLDWEHFSQTLAEIIYANQDVANPSMGWLMTHFSLHPMTESDIDNYVEEVGRLSPIFPTSMPRLTTKNHDIGDIVIGEGTPIVLDFVALGYSPDWRMEDLDTFRPERFNEVEDRKKFVNRFGYGARKCPGHKLANNLFHDALRYMRENWRLIPKTATELSDVTIDPAKAFITPLHDVWIIPTSDITESDCGDIKKIYYNCSPISDLTESAFMAVSVNARSPFLTDESKVDNILRYLSDRSAVNGETEPTVIYVCDVISQFNIQAFNRRKPDKAMEEAIELGDRFVEAFQKSVDSLQVSERIRICRWSDDQNRASDELIAYLKSVDALDERVGTIASNYLEYRGQNRLNKSYDRKLELVKEYIFHEIPVLILGILIDGVHYRLLHYSGSHTHLSKFVNDANSLHNLINDIYTQPEFEPVLNTLVASSETDRAKVPGFIGIQF